MLFAIHTQNTRYQGGQTAIVYLVTTVEAIAAAGLAFAFTDGHPIMAYSDFYDDLNALEMIDWNVMKRKYWNATDNDRTPVNVYRDWYYSFQLSS